MAYDGYQLAEPVSANSYVHAMKGVMVVGAAGATIHPFKTPNYSSGLTGYAVAGACGDAVQITGNAQGVIFPVAVAYVGDVAAGAQVYRLA